MRVLKSLLLLSAALSTMANAVVIPDLFGAYQRGAEQARIANQQDAYYYQTYRTQPSVPTSSFRMAVREKVNGKYVNKGRMQLSIKNRDGLCWQVTGLEDGMVYSATEVFGTPFDASKIIGPEVISRTSARDGKAIIKDTKLLNNTSYAIYREMTSNPSISACWVFKEEAPVGIYTLRVVVGSVDFGTHNFEIVK